MSTSRVILGGRTRDYILCAVRAYGPLIFVVATPTCAPEQVMAVRPGFVMGQGLIREFGAAAQTKLLQAWERVDSDIPIVCDLADNAYMPYGPPEIEMDVITLYIFG